MHVEGAIMAYQADREEITQRKVFQYLGLFCVLAVIYAISLSIYIKFVSAAPVVNGLGDLMRPIVKVFPVSALPFAVLAYRDKTWRSSDAAHVCIGAWAAACWASSIRYGTSCGLVFLLPFIPFILSALLAHTLAHTIGTLCHRDSAGGWPR